MKKQKINISKYVFYIFFISFLIIYLSGLTGYYEYQNHIKTNLTETQIKKFEFDIKKGKKIDMNEYLSVDTKKYNNNLSNMASKLSSSISNLVNNGVKYTFKYISKLIDE